MDSEFAIDPSSVSAMVIVLTKAEWIGFVCLNVRWRSDLVWADFFPPKKIFSYRIGVKILFHSRDTRQHAENVLCITDPFSSFLPSDQGYFFICIEISAIIFGMSSGRNFERVFKSAAV